MVALAKLRQGAETTAGDRAAVEQLLKDSVRTYVSTKERRGNLADMHTQLCETVTALDMLEKDFPRPVGPGRATRGFQTA